MGVVEVYGGSGGGVWWEGWMSVVGGVKECGGRGGGVWEGLRNVVRGVRCVVERVRCVVRGVEVCGKECGVWERVEVCDGRGVGG